MTAATALNRVPAAALVIAAVVSVQFGGALAATLLPAAGVVGTVALRMAFSALVLSLFVRPRWRGRSRADWVAVLLYAAAVGLMNLAFYGALTRLPIGVAVTIEFVGPLTLAAVLSRRILDLGAVLAAAIGVGLISGAFSTPWSQLDHRGIALALAAGAMWAAYILAGARTAQHFNQLDGLAIALILNSAVLLPIGLAQTGIDLLHPEILAKGLGVAMLSTLIAYSLEMVALRRLRPSVFGVLLSLEPAAAAIAGLIVLSQDLSWVQLAGMALVVAASALIMGSQRNSPPLPAEPA